jgi:hypothetical protein
MKQISPCASRRNLGVLLAFFFVLLPVTVSSHDDSTPELKPCATDPTYREFEEIQQNFYEGNVFSKRLLLDDLDLAKRSANDRLVLPGTLNSSPQLQSFMYQNIHNLKLPTCFEDPVMFASIKGHIELLEAARKELQKSRKDLKLGIDSVPKYGSLPIQDVNAYRYYFPDTKETVLAFNNEFARFGFVLTGIAVGTVPSDKVNDLSYLSRAKPEEVVTQIFVHPEWTDALESGLFEFLHLRAAPRPPDDQAHILLAAPLLGGINLFATAHEYAHVINGDKPVSLQSLNNMADLMPAKVPSDTSAVVWSWPQELKADELGVELLLTSAKDITSKDPTFSDQWLYAARGASLYFVSMEMIEDARIMRRSGVPPPKLTDTQRDCIRLLAEGPNSCRDSVLKDVPLGDHPPAWLRGERVNTQLNRAAQATRKSEREASFDRFGAVIVRNMAVLWAMSRSRIANDLQEPKNKSSRRRN